MRKAIDFIDRQTELARIADLIATPKTHLCYLSSDGGNGKTRLLEQIPVYLQSKAFAAVCLDIIDFDDLSYQFTDNLVYLLLERIPNVESSQKDEVYEQLESLERMERDEDSWKTRDDQKKRIVEQLANIVNISTIETPLVFRFDTVEKMPDDIRESLVEFVGHLKKAHVVFSGRPEPGRSFWSLIEAAGLHDIHEIKLEPFGPTASREYLERKESLRNASLSVADMEKLLTLSGGRPILIDLAYEYFVRPHELKPHKSPEQPTIAGDSLSKEDFESQVVQYVISVGGRSEQLILLLSRIFPMSQDRLSKFFKLSKEDVKALFERSQAEAYIKTITSKDGEVKISLHDEMRRLIEKHVWGKLDPTHFRRQRDSGIAHGIYMAEASQLRDKIAEIRRQYNSPDTKIDTFAYILLLQLKRQREIAIEEWIKHALYHDFRQGFEEWKDVVETLREEHEYRFIQHLCRNVEPYIENNPTIQLPANVNITEERRYHFLFVFARAKLDAGDLPAADIDLQSLLKDYHADTSRRREIYNSLGVLRRLQGELDQAIDYQTKCRRLLESDSFGPIANVENQLGYVHLLYKDTDPGSGKKARMHFERALKAANAYLDQVDNLKEQEIIKSLIASVTNNLGYIHGLDSHYVEAELKCKRAISYWQQGDRRKEMAWAKTNLGVLARNQRQYQQSEQRLREAIGLLAAPNDWRELTKAYFELGWTQWFMAAIKSEKERRVALLAEARDSLEIALKYAVEDHDYRQEQPDIYHQLASVYWYLGRETGDIELQSKARSHNQIAIRLCNELKNNRYAIDAIIGEMEWDFDIGVDENVEQHLALLKPYRRYNFPLYFGRVHRILGDWAYRKKDYDEAFDQYGPAMDLINQHGGYGPYTIEIELERLATEKLGELPSSIVATSYLDSLRHVWENRKIRGRIDLLFWVKEQEEQIKLVGVRA